MLSAVSVRHREGEPSPRQRRTVFPERLERFYVTFQNLPYLIFGATRPAREDQRERSVVEIAEEKSKFGGGAGTPGTAVGGAIA